ncbi:Kinase suppressor of Ras 2 [Frankliniella fusca]|uniref:Kinase suppressor of Ras 2 n=1 Tax=Frankliniella fusca TaxID=407009 RepID=A0AAE1LBA2_9NEOP|nr:Kinase suppressor of Ras 2 [Frankliniella fusca]
MANEDKTERDPRGALLVVQSMIDISADRLDGLRTQCATSAELTQQEIRTLEGKLVKLYSRLLLNKSSFIENGALRANEVINIPPLDQWLKVVGLTPDSITGLCKRISTLEDLQLKSDNELRGMLVERQAREEDIRRLIRSLHNLKRYIQDLKLRGDEANDTEPPLYWDSWEHQSPQRTPTSVSPRHLRQRAARGSVPSEDYFPHNNNNFSYSPSLGGSTSSSVNSLPQVGSCTPTHFPPLSPPVLPIYPPCTPPSTPPVNKGKGEKLRFPTTPPPRRKIHGNSSTHSHSHSNQISQDQLVQELKNLVSQENTDQGTARYQSQYHHIQHHPQNQHHLQQQQQQQQQSQQQNALGDAQTLTKSKSHESQLGNRVEGAESSQSSDAAGTANGQRLKRGRLPTEPGPNSDYGQTSPLLSSPIKSPPYSTGGTDSDDNSAKSSLQVPKSPRPAPILTRGMAHDISHRFTKTYKMIANCDYCDKQMFMGLKCTECKYKCHKDCKSKVPPSCGLPRALVEEFRKTLKDGIGQPNSNQSPSMRRPSPSHSLNNNFFTRKDRKRSHPQPSIQIPPFQGPDSSSNTSSCNSSTPSSPALMMQQHASSAAPSTKQQSFHFPEVVTLSRGVTLETHPLTAPPALEEIMDSHKAKKEGVSMDSDKTLSVSGSGSISTDSERTPIRVDSQDSQVSDGEATDGKGWPRQNRKGLSIPRGWLCYLAPEIMCSLKAQQNQLDDELPFSKASDVYAFGTVWYELLCGEWPFKAQPPESIIWQVGKGMKQTLANLQASRDVKAPLFPISPSPLPSLRQFAEKGKPKHHDRHYHLPKDTSHSASSEAIRPRNSQVTSLRNLAEQGKPKGLNEWHLDHLNLEDDNDDNGLSLSAEDILMSCWSYKPGDRPDFVRLLNTFEKLPKKRLVRSPSHPIQLSRSAESVF